MPDRLTPGRYDLVNVGTGVTRRLVVRVGQDIVIEVVAPVVEE